MSRIEFSLGVFAFVAVLSALGGGDAAATDTGLKPTEVVLCHVPPGNPANARSITVDSSAVQAHLAHGDALGACSSQCESDGTDCSDNADCCSGQCLEGFCRTCTENGAACESDGACCSGICTGTTHICATDCVPLDVSETCSPELDCCSGSNCNIDNCFRYDELPCSSPGQSCETQDCCFYGLYVCDGTTHTCVQSQ
jgi:hypothetical protein